MKTLRQTRPDAARARWTPASVHQARGSVLLVVVVLLLLASLFVLFALNVGRFEQKTSGNDVRAKLAQEIADAGVSVGVEYFNAHKDLFTDLDQWEVCADDTFPCGAIPEFTSADPAKPRRSTVFYYNPTGGNSLASRLLPTQPTQGNASGGFDAQQQVGATLCLIKAQPAPPPGSPPPDTVCTTNPDEAGRTWILTVVSKGSLPGEGSSATATLTLGAYSLFSPNLGTPPVMASGNVQIGGALQIVTAPDAGGDGIPVSVWTRLAMEKNGTPNTCHLDEFLRQGGTSSGPGYYDDMAICHTCSCSADTSLSYNYSNSKRCQGADIVDIDNNEPNDAGCPSSANIDIYRAEFPKDMFSFVFNTEAWLDSDQGSGGDTYANKEYHFGETRLVEDCDYTDPVTGANRTNRLPADTCTLLNIQRKTHIGDGVNDAAECTELTDTYANTGADAADELRGVVWVNPAPILDHATDEVIVPGYACEVKNANQIGRPIAPVLLVHDGSLTGLHLQLYGLLFVRAPNAVVKLDKDTGGPVGAQIELGLNGGAIIYGAAIVQGAVTSGGGGNAALVYNGDVLKRLFNNPDDVEFKAIPGSWTDRVRY